MSDEEGAFVSEEAITPKVIKRCPRPSTEEVDGHDVAHVPCRSWCPLCQGQGKDKGSPKKCARFAVGVAGNIIGLYVLKECVGQVREGEVIRI